MVQDWENHLENITVKTNMDGKVKNDNKYQDCTKSGIDALEDLQNCIKSLNMSTVNLEDNLNKCWANSEGTDSIIKCMKNTHKEIYSLKNKLVNFSSQDNPCKIQKCLQNIDLASGSKSKHKSKSKQITRALSHIPDHWDNGNYLVDCDDPEKILLNLSHCITDIDKITSNMDLKYINCLKSSKKSEDVFKCMKNVEVTTNKLIETLSTNKSCLNIHCDKIKKATDKGDRDVYKQCLTKQDVDQSKFKTYLKNMNDQTNNLNQHYMDCLQQGKSQGDIEKCMHQVSEDMSSFKNYLSDFCDSVTRSSSKPSLDIDMDKQILLSNICKQHKSSLLNILSNCGYDRHKLDHKYPINTLDECKKTINSLVDKVNVCLSNISNQDTYLLDNKITSLSNKIDQESTRSVSKNRKKNNNKRKKRNTCKNKKKTKKKTNTCKPWQLCWIKKSGYDPQEDVHNIYYGFAEKCSTAMGGAAGCDPSKPVYHLPPPLGF